MVFTSFVVDVGSPRMEIQETESAKPEYFKNGSKKKSIFRKDSNPLAQNKRHLGVTKGTMF